MNLYNLLNVMPVSIRLRNEQADEDSGNGIDIQYFSPVIDSPNKTAPETAEHTPSAEQAEGAGEKITTVRLFKDERDSLNDLLTLSKIWKKLVPTIGTLEEEQRKIVKWLFGQRNIEDSLLLMEWLSENLEISNAVLASLLA